MFGLLGRGGQAKPEWKLKSDGDTLIATTGLISCTMVGCATNHIPPTIWIEKHPKPKDSDPVTVNRGEWQAILKRLEELENRNKK